VVNLTTLYNYICLFLACNYSIAQPLATAQPSECND